MKIYTSLSEVPALENGCVVTVGNFDGVHLGHQAIFSRARELAAAESLPLIVFTFDPAPVRVLRPNIAPRLITPREIKIKLLTEQGIDQLLIVYPTPQFLGLSPEQFAKEVLVDKLAARHVVEGQTFAFGTRRTGTMVSLDDLAKQLGFNCHLVPACTCELGGEGPVAVNSTLVRQYVLAGQVQKVQQCLGRPYLMPGLVVPGREQGRRLGFPTANLEPYSKEQLPPEDGVYTGHACLGQGFEQAWAGQDRYAAAISIGRCETFSHGVWQIEAYLLDYPVDAPDLYHQHLLLSFGQRIRDQAKFDSPEELNRAIESDCRLVRQHLQQPAQG